MMRPCLGIFVLLVATAHDARGQAVPGTVSFTGRLTDGTSPITGSHDLRLRLFRNETGGTEIWEETHAITTQDGLVYVEMGSTTSLDEVVFNGSKVFLEVAVDGTAMSPRLAIASVPYAIRAGTAASADTIGGLDATDLVTSVTAGSGLTGGGAGGTVSLGADFAGSGSATTVARSDHDHDGTYLPLGGSLSCTGTDKVVGVAPATGNVICGSDVDTTSTYTAGNGLTLTSGQFAVSFAGSGTATTVSRSDHHHDAAYVDADGDSMSGPLTVAGTIESTTGGFRFPDGTVQATANKIVAVTYQVSSTRTPLPTACSVVLESFLYNKRSPTSILLIDGSIAGHGNYSGSMTQAWRLGTGTEVVAQGLMYDENVQAKVFPTKVVIAGHATTGPQIMTFRYYSANPADCGNRPFNVYNPNASDDTRLAQTSSVYVIWELEP